MTLPDELRSRRGGLPEASGVALHGNTITLDFNTREEAQEAFDRLCVACAPAPCLLSKAAAERIEELEREVARLKGEPSRPLTEMSHEELVAVAFPHPAVNVKSVDAIDAAMRELSRRARLATIGEDGEVKG